MKIIKDIAYDSSLKFRGKGDLYLPTHLGNAQAALCIHGGAWNSMDKSGLAGVAEFLSENGIGVFNINYRLLKDAAWPACGDDCLNAFDFLINAKHPSMEKLNRSKIIIIGASAGGHLALMTGLRMLPEKVKGIIAISPITDLVSHFKFMPKHANGFLKNRSSQEDYENASPIYNVNKNPPPILCTHNLNDRLVLPSQSEKFIELCKSFGGKTELYLYENPDNKHGIWRNEKCNPRRLLPHLEEKVFNFINKEQA